MQDQTVLREILTHPGRHPDWRECFLRQHARMHSACLDPQGGGSLEDAVCENAPEEVLRRIPPRGEHSIAWVLWHLARIEDVTMNVLAAEDEQVFRREDWPGRLGVDVVETGNALTPQEIAALSEAVDIPALRAYRLAVGRSTRRVVSALTVSGLSRRVEPGRLERLLDEGAVVEASRGLLDYWGRRDIAGLLLMPPTRHCLVHLNEALEIKRRLLRP